MERIAVVQRDHSTRVFRPDTVKQGFDTCKPAKFWELWPGRTPD